MKRISIRIEDVDDVRLEKVIEKRQKDGDKISKSELIREYVVAELNINDNENAVGSEKTIRKQHEETEQDQPIDTKPINADGIDTNQLEDKVDKLSYEIRDMKDMLNTILTTVSYPRELEKLDDIKAMLDRMVGPEE